MSEFLSKPLLYSSEVSLAMLSAAMLLLLYRLGAGPTFADRAIATDTTAVIIVGMLAVAAVQRDQPELLLVAAMLALITFIGTIAFATYIARRRDD